MSELLRLLAKNEQIACIFEQIAHLLIFWQKKSDSLGKRKKNQPGLQMNRQKRFSKLFCLWILDHIGHKSGKSNEKLSVKVDHQQAQQRMYLH